MVFRGILILMTAGLTAMGCTGSKKTVIDVHPFKVDCVGMAPMKCLKIKYEDSTEWEILNTGIDGFDFESGYAYRLKIKKYDIPNPPADGSSIGYKWIKTISMVKTDEKMPENWKGTQWKLERMGPHHDPQPPIKGTELNIRFMEDGNIRGKAGCNGYFSNYEHSGSTISVGMIGATEMFCTKPDGIMEQEQGFLGILGNAEKIMFDGGKLILKTTYNNVLVFTSE